MPGPVVYVAVAISAVAAAMAFKEVRGLGFLHTTDPAHCTTISSSTILISVQGSPLGGRALVDAEGLDLTCILHPHRHHLLMMMMM